MSLNFLHFLFFTHKIHCVSVSKYPCKLMDVCFFQFSIASNAPKETLIFVHSPYINIIFNIILNFSLALIVSSILMTMKNPKVTKIKINIHLHKLRRVNSTFSFSMIIYSIFFSISMTMKNPKMTKIKISIHLQKLGE